jgi:hypothetical protein
MLTLITSQDYGRALDIYKLAISNVPHKKFTFAKLWLQFARFHIRRQDLKNARNVLGTSIGMCPKEKLFSGYIDLELEVCRLTRTMQPALNDISPSSSRSLTTHGNSTKSTSNSTPQTRRLGLSMPSLRRRCRTSPECGLSTSWVFHKRNLRCPKCSGSRTLTLRAWKAHTNATVPESGRCTRDWWRKLAMSRSGYRGLCSRAESSNLLPRKTMMKPRRSRVCLGTLKKQERSSSAHTKTCGVKTTRMR